MAIPFGMEDRASTPDETVDSAVTLSNVYKSLIFHEKLCLTAMSGCRSLLLSATSAHTGCALMIPSLTCRDYFSCYSGTTEILLVSFFHLASMIH